MNDIARPSILLVDDDALLLSILTRALEMHGYAITSAISGADAKEKLANGNFDLVLTDMKMETDTAGYDVVRAASAKPEQPAIIIFTAFPIFEAQWRSAGAHLALSKPISIPKLREAVASTIHQQRLALMKQQERELQILLAQSNASLPHTKEIEDKLLALAARIAEIESVGPVEPTPNRPPKSPPPS